MASKMPQKFRLTGNAVPGNSISFAPHLLNHFNQKIKVTLRVHTSGKSQTDKFMGRRHFLTFVIKLPKHNASKFNAPNTALYVKSIHKTDPGVLKFGYMREECPGIQKNSMAAYWLYKRNIISFQFLAEIFNGCMTVNLIIVIQRFHKTNRNNLQVSPG